MNEEVHSDEVSVADIFNMARRYKWLLLGLPLAGAVVAALWVSFVLHPVWEASAVIEIGRAAGQGQPGQQFVEPIPNVVARMRLPTFAVGAVNFSGIKPDELNDGLWFYRSAKVSQVKGADLIEITLRAPSGEMAKNLIQGGVAYLQKTHNEIMSVSIEKYKKELLMLNEDIKKLHAEANLLNNKLLATHNWNAFDATLSASILQNKSTELRAMIQRKSLLEERISPSFEYTTRVVDNISVSDGPVSPNKPLIIEVAMLLGLLGAVVVAFAHYVITAKQANNI